MHKLIFLFVLFSITIPIYSFGRDKLVTTGVGGGILYSDSSGTSHFWNPYLSFTKHTETEKMEIKSSADFIFLKQQFLQGMIKGGSIGLKGTNQRIKIESYADVFKIENLRIGILETIPLAQSGSTISLEDGFFFLCGTTGGMEFSSFPLKLTIDTKLITNSWNSGDFFYFYGYPVIPATGIYSIQAEWDNCFSISFSAINSNPFFYSNDDKNILGNLTFLGLKQGLKYKLIFPQQKFYTGFDYIYLNNTGNLSLTSQNQQYVFFPYKFLNAQWNGILHLINVFACYKWKNYRETSFFDIYTGCLACVYDYENYSASYLEKDNMFFGGNKGEYSGKVKILQGSALIYGNIQYTYVPFSFFKLSVNKALIFPLMGKTLKKYIYPEQQSTSSPRNPSAEQVISAIKTILLSGLSFSVSFSF